MRLPKHLSGRSKNDWDYVLKKERYLSLNQNERKNWFEKNTLTRRGRNAPDKQIGLGNCSTLRVYP
jgi:hypothetical protein